MKDNMAANVHHQCKKYAEVFNVLPRQRSLFSILCVDIAVISKGEHDSPSDEMLHVLLEKWRVKVSIFTVQQQKNSPHGPVVGYPMDTVQFLQNFSSAVLTNNQILKMEGGGPCCGGGLNSWSPGAVDVPSGDAMEIIQQRSAADWELRQRDGRMGQLALCSQDGEGMRCTEERSSIKLLHIKTFWMQLWLWNRHLHRIKRSDTTQMKKNTSGIL